MTESIRVTSVTSPEEIRTVATLAREIWTAHYTPIIGAGQVAYMLDRFQSEAAIAKDIQSGTYRYDLVLRSGRPVGYSAYRPDEQHKDVFLSKIYVKDEERGRGLSRLMLNRVTALAKERGFPTIRLTVNRHNGNALAAYRKLGFRLTGQVKTDIGGGYFMDDFVLSKSLKPTTVRAGDINFRDPYVLLHEGVYYLYGTEGETCWEGDPKRLVFYTGTDLENWDGPFVCFSPPDGFWADRNYWAPECHKYKGAFYLFVTFTSAERRGTQILRSSHPGGPFVPLSDGPYTPEGWDALDGTLFVEEDGTPWSVFCHEWKQIGNGTVCATRLKPDLSGPVGADPLTLFSARQAAWTKPVRNRDDSGPEGYVTDGPFLYRLHTGRLLMGWSSYTGDRRYTIGQAYSDNGITGPWHHLNEPIYDDDGGHGMFFRTRGGRLMMTIHKPNSHCDERPLFMEMEENATGLHVKKKQET